MIKRICPKCGKNVEIFVEKFCLDCFRREIEKELRIPEKITIYKCKHCGKYSLSKKHLFNFFEEAIEHLGKHADFFKKINLERKIKYKDSEMFVYFFYDNILVLERRIEIQEKLFTCIFCAMKLSGYKQAIIQLRFDVSESLIKEIEDLVRRRNLKDFLSFISKIERNKDGIDLYIGSKKTAYEILNLILNNLNSVEYKISKTLVGVKNGKKVYLDTILIRKV
ncbi:MAG: NMD3-related protein [Candidatus Aenigmatarchaeota archaeon]